MLAERDRSSSTPAREIAFDNGTGAAAAARRDGFLQILWRQRYVIAGTVALAVCIAVAYLLTATRIYRSDARLYVQPAGGGIVTKDETGRPSAPGTINIYTEAERLSSTPILAHTLADPQVQAMKTFEGVSNRFDFLKAILAVDVGAKNDLISVSIYSHVKEDAAPLLERVISAYIDFQTKKSRTATDRLVELLRNERRLIEQELQTKSKEMVDYKRDRGVLFSNNDQGGGDINLERVKALSQALTAAQIDTLNAKSAYDEALRPIAEDEAKLKSVRELQAYHGFTPVSAAEEAQLRSELFQWQTRLGDMQQQYLPNHPAVRNMQKRVDQLNIAYVAAMERRWLSLVKREAELQTTFQDQQKVAIDRSADAVAYARIEQDLKLKEQTAQTLDQRIRELDLSEAASAAVDVQVVEPARAANRAAKPVWQVAIGVALVLGLIAGLGLACMRDWLDPRLRDAEEVKAVLGMPILGMVPRMPANLAPAVRGQKLLLDPGSEVAEAYRALRTAIKFGVPEGQAKTILIASPASGDGKTTVASNLAIGLAQSGKRVLLLDADLRHPKQHEIFGVENHAGLADLLSREMAPQEVTLKTIVPLLEIMPCGPTPESPADLLNSQRFIDVIDELTERYDHVVIDSPPVMAVTDARIIAASCDACVLVLRADRANRKLSEMARDGLASVGANLVGLVLNCVPSSEGVYTGGNAYYTSANGSSGIKHGQTERAVRVEAKGEQASTAIVGLDGMTLGDRPNRMSN